jgi:hypothetical protein
VRRSILAAGVLVTVTLLASGESALAQTTSARGESLELSSRAGELLADGKDDLY